MKDKPRLANMAENPSTAVEHTISEYVSRMVDALLQAKDKVDWNPVILIKWDLTRWVVMREPSVNEAEFISSIRSTAGVYARAPIVERFILSSSQDFNPVTDKRAGYLEACFNTLIQWCKTSPLELNEMIETSRSDGHTSSDLMISYLQTSVDPTLSIPDKRNMPFSSLIREVFAAERMRYGTDQYTKFEVLTDEEHARRAHQDRKDNVDRIIQEAPPQDETPLPSPSLDKVIEDQERWKEDRLITIPHGMDPSQFKRRDFR